VIYSRDAIAENYSLDFK